MSNKKWSYYNENDPKAAAWIRELIKQNLIPQGEVDERSITEINPRDIDSFAQAHFFAGICGWPLALQLAGWPATRPVWTGSCPCQPFSTAGKGLAQADERHLWPVFFNLIKECRPEYVFGEQVASAIGKGWLDGISTDLGEEGYTCGSAVLGAHSLGSPHIRQRLYWVAYTMRSGQQGQGVVGRPSDSTEKEDREINRTLNAGRSSCGSSEASGVAQPDELRPQGHELLQSGLPSGSSETDRVADANGSRSLDGQHPKDGWGAEAVAKRGGDCGMADPMLTGEWRNQWESGTEGCSAWLDCTTIPCRDGKARRIPTEPAFFPLAHGIPARVVRLRGYGNAIVPQVAAEFIQAFQETQAATA
jgi:DNA (cytosine-5)-methyltransferase 1